MADRDRPEEGANSILRWYGISVFLPGAALLVVIVVMMMFEADKDTIYWVVAPGVLLISYINGRGLHRRLTSRK